MGGVVIDVSFDKVLERWSAHAGANLETLRARFTLSEAYEQHERGEIDAEAYYASLRTTLGIAMSDAQFEEGWNAIFLGEIAPTVQLIRQLEGKLPLYAFSNTNATHQLFWSQRYADALTPFERIFVSSEMGKRKPESDAFLYVVSEIGLHPGEIMFFDDTEVNVSAAKATGMKAVRINSPGDVRRALKAFL